MQRTIPRDCRYEAGRAFKLLPNDVLKKVKKKSDVKNLVQLFAPLDRPVMINGETGVGKELIANAIHHVSSRHKSGFFILRFDSEIMKDRISL